MDVWLFFACADFNGRHEIGLIFLIIENDVKMVKNSRKRK